MGTEREFQFLDDMEVDTFVKKSLLFANAAAFLAITVKGAMPSMPTLTEVTTFLEKYVPWFFDYIV